MDHPKPLEEARVILHAYDIAHKLACILKALLKENMRWQAFVTAAAASKSQVQLGEAAHLAPPNQRSKARYMNLDELLGWAIRVLDLVKRHAKAMRIGINHSNTEEIADVNAEDPPLDFKNVLHFSWILEHEEIIMQASRYLTVTHHVRNKLRTEGIHSHTYSELYMEGQSMGIDQDSKTQAMFNAILAHIKEQTFGLKEGEILLVSSEILESLFGKMKHLMNENLKHGLTGKVLAIVSAVGTLDVEIVKQALEEVSDQDVQAWTQENIGQTYTQKRRRYLGRKGKKPGRKAKDEQKLSGTFMGRFQVA